MKEKGSNESKVEIIDIPQIQANKRSRLIKRIDAGKTKYVKMTELTHNFEDRCISFLSGASSQTDEHVIEVSDLKTVEIIQRPMPSLFGMIYFKYLEILSNRNLKQQD